MSRRSAKSGPSSAVAAWGWYATLVFPEPKAGGSDPGMVARAGPPRAFWACWWRGDPRLAEHPPDPDDYGFITGAMPLDQAVGAAYAALRAGRGQHVYDVCIGEAWAIRAYREGAPTRRSTHLDFETIAYAGLDLLGLPPDASPAAVKDAWRSWLKRAHPDAGGEAVDLEAARRSYDAALSFALRRVEQQQRAAVVAGKVVVDERKFTSTLRTVAKRVREAAEVLFGPMTLEGCDADTLGGYCTVAALGLVHGLREAGVTATIGAGECAGAPHWWAEATAAPGAKPVIVDITATQFWKRARIVVAASESKVATRYNARSRQFSRGQLLSVELVPHLHTLWTGLPAAWWRGGRTMEPRERRELEARIREARLRPLPPGGGPKLAVFLRRFS